MKITSLLLPVYLLLTCCDSKDSFELEIITPSLNSAVTSREKAIYYCGVGDRIPPKESLTIIKYKLTNNTNKTYFFNLNSRVDSLEYEYININGARIALADSNNKLVKLQIARPSRGALFHDDLVAEALNYNSFYSERLKNFTIHPNETLYFEWFLCLPFGTVMEENVYWTTLDPNQKYFAEILLHSDYDKTGIELLKTDIKNIEENNYEIFTGTIKSKNKIPITFSKIKE